MRRISETVQRLPYVEGAEDDRGNPADSWGDPEDLGIYAFDPGSTSEPALGGHDRAISQPAILAPVGKVVKPRDKIYRKGATYEVDGDLLAYRNPFDSSVDGILVQLKAVAG